jgi:hypothetical protein
MRSAPKPWLAMTLAFCVASTAMAHHSVAFYSTDKIELAGEITKIDWKNPHIQFELQTLESNGVEKTWRLESSSIFLREKDGVTRDLFRVGDKVRVAGRASSHDAAALLVTNMLLPDGREAPLWPNTAPYFVTADKWITAKPQLVDAAAENRGLFRVWRPNEVSLANLPYTDAAVSARKSFDLVIETSLVNWPYFDQIGTPLSENVQIEERYKVSEDQSRLDVEITTIDAATFKSPAVLKSSWLAYGDTIQRYDCQR